MEDMDNLLPLAVAARIAGTTYWLSWRMVANGACPAARRGERWFVKASDLRAAVTPQPCPAGRDPAA